MSVRDAGSRAYRSISDGPNSLIGVGLRVDSLTTRIERLEERSSRLSMDIAELRRDMSALRSALFVGFMVVFLFLAILAKVAAGAP